MKILEDHKIFGLNRLYHKQESYIYAIKLHIFVSSYIKASLHSDNRKIVMKILITGYLSIENVFCICFKLS